MSWFSELTSKAEAMLVKLDQNTAQALQNPDQILASTKLLSNLTQNASDDEQRNEEQSETFQNGRRSKQRTIEDDMLPTTAATDDATSEELLAFTSFNNQEEPAPNQQAYPGLKPLAIEEQHHNEQGGNRQHITIVTDNVQTFNSNEQQTKQPVAPSSPQTYNQQTRKFKLQTSTLRRSLYGEQGSSGRANGHNHKTSSRRNPNLIELGADDIRASINRSLLEYSSQSATKSALMMQDEPPTTYSSHFDSRPNLISSSPPLPLDDFNQLNAAIDRLHSSGSFSINVPDDGDHHTNVASQILTQSAPQRKSVFNLHKVIDNLANHKGQSQPLIGEKTKLRLRRAQMRAASYFRRLNYYFRAYPTMKYWMIGYLVMLQILVIYVLFFYQSSSSSSYLTQIKHQQEELQSASMQQSNSEKTHPVTDSDQRINTFR